MSIRSGTKIALNSARCKLCDQTLVSKHRHDFNSCKCGNLSVDGGIDYIKRSVCNGWDSVEELSKAAEEEVNGWDELEKTLKSKRFQRSVVKQALALSKADITDMARNIASKKPTKRRK